MDCTTNIGWRRSPREIEHTFCGLQPSTYRFPITLATACLSRHQRRMRVTAVRTTWYQLVQL